MNTKRTMTSLALALVLVGGTSSAADAAPITRPGGTATHVCVAQPSACPVRSVRKLRPSQMPRWTMLRPSLLRWSVAR